MTTTEQRLADALRAMLDDPESLPAMRVGGEALAAYDAQQGVGSIRLNDAEQATIIAALRFYQEGGQGDPYNRSDDIHDIATNGGEVMSSLDDEGIDKLCARMGA